MMPPAEHFAAPDAADDEDVELAETLPTVPFVEPTPLKMEA